MSMMETSAYEEKKEYLHTRMGELTKENVAVAFSGGVDSSLLLKLAVLHAKENSTEVFAYTAKTELHPMQDLDISLKIANEIGVELHVIEIDELKEAGIENNPKERCYFCKRFIFQSMIESAKQKGVRVFLEGTNIDDTKVYRPGLKALEELEIISPLKEAAMTKAEVRKMAAEYEITTASRPSTPCMATRFPYGTKLTVENLKKVEEGETFLRSLGFYNVRLRVHENIARLEIDVEAFETVLSRREEIVKALKELGYDYVTLDLVGFRSGSMDEPIGMKK